MITDPKVVLIIGNGFDLNLGLETSYTHIINSDKFKTLKDSGNLICEHLDQKLQLENWVDVENELKALDQSIQPSVLRPQFDALSATLIDYLKSIAMDIDKGSVAFKTIELIAANDPDSLLIIDYNFTNTTQLILMSLGFSQEFIDKHILKIHGSLSQGEIVFGIEDSHPLKHPNNVFLRKSANTTVPTYDVYEYLAQAERIIFFGHSIGQTDHSDFNTFFRRAKQRGGQWANKDLTIYHYKEDGRTDIQVQLDVLTSRSLGDLIRFNKVKLVDSAN